MPEEPWIHVIQLQEKLQAMQLIKYQTSSRIRTKLKKKKRFNVMVLLPCTFLAFISNCCVSLNFFSFWFRKRRSGTYKRGTHVNFLCQFNIILVNALCKQLDTDISKNWPKCSQKFSKQDINTPKQDINTP